MSFYDFKINEDCYLFMVNDMPGNFGPAFYPITKGKIVKESKDESILFIASNGTERLFSLMEQRFIRSYFDKIKAYSEYKDALQKAKNEFTQIVEDDYFDDYDDDDQESEKWCNNVLGHKIDIEKELQRVNQLIIKMQTIDKSKYKTYINRPLFGSMYWIRNDNRVIKLNAVSGHLEKNNGSFCFYEDESGKKYDAAKMIISEDKEFLTDQYKALAEKAIVEINRRIDVLNRLYFDIAEEIKDI